ncbi:transcriptional regulator [Mycolicibacterium fortuitum]|uniref:helix-turn-helix domain-containing protein n=1 Tax=Mycolicibacterium fortuitum TaxID=1766 RepID=UPI0007ED78AF|nr:helix-turn-helix transcriptional regulator [Mycolicibacterium fortuitum]OBK02795.1 transcriptional regulator [Mycolicibacterium fortuitum]
MGEEKPEKWVPKLVTEADAAVGAVLRRVRERAGWTLEQAGERSGINKSVLSKTERGERPLRVFELGPIAEAYGMTLEKLTAEIGSDPAVRAATSRE